MIARAHELLLGRDVLGPFLDRRAGRRRTRRGARAHAVGDGLLEAVAMADAAEVGEQQIGDRVVAAFERRGEPEPFVVLGEQRPPQNPAAEAVTFVGDEQAAGLPGRHGLVRGGRVARRDEHVARVRDVAPAVAQPPDPGVGERRLSRPCHCSMSTRDGTTTSTNRPRRSASAAAAIATSVLPEPVTASTTPRRPQRSQLIERVELPPVELAVGRDRSREQVQRRGRGTWTTQLPSADRDRDVPVPISPRPTGPGTGSARPGGLER